MNAVTYFSGMVFLPAFRVFPRGQFFIVERSLEKKNRYFMYAYYWLRKKVPHVAIVFSFQCTKKSNGERSPTLQNWFNADALGKWQGTLTM